MANGCPRRFATQEMADEHAETAHGGRMYECRLCRHFFVSEAILNSHNHSVHWGRHITDVSGLQLHGYLSSRSGTSDAPDNRSISGRSGAVVGHADDAEVRQPQQYQCYFGHCLARFDTEEEYSEHCQHHLPRAESPFARANEIGPSRAPLRQRHTASRTDHDFEDEMMCAKAISSHEAEEALDNASLSQLTSDMDDGTGHKNLGETEGLMEAVSVGFRTPDQEHEAARNLQRIAVAATHVDSREARSDDDGSFTVRRSPDVRSVSEIAVLFPSPAVRNSRPPTGSSMNASQLSFSGSAGAQVSSGRSSPLNVSGGTFFHSGSALSGMQEATNSSSRTRAIADAANSLRINDAVADRANRADQPYPDTLVISDDENDEEYHEVPGDEIADPSMKKQ